MTHKTVISKMRLIQNAFLCVILIHLVITVISSPDAADALSQKWVARYNTPVSRADYAVAYTVDPSSGYLYFTGSSKVDSYNRDIITVKCDPDGRQLWMSRFNNPISYEDWAADIEVDDTGNVYVAGASQYYKNSTDIILIKYDSNGNQVWTALYNGTADGPDYVSDLAIDASGNLYIAGESPGKNTLIDIVTLKYDSEGNQLWVARYDASGFSSDYAKGLVVDESGNVYVGGDSNNDFIVIKYDNHGDQLWAHSYDGGSHDGGIEAMTLDADGHVYVSGLSFGTSGNHDMVTLKMDPAGTLLWEARYNGPSDGSDEVSAIHVDRTGSVTVLGRTETESGSGTILIKYDQAGNPLWTAQDNGTPGNDIECDDSGNRYVAGHPLRKFDQDGHLLWSVDCDACGGFNLDSVNNIYAVGTKNVGLPLPLPSGKSQDFDIITAKYDEDGRRIWQVDHPLPSNSHDQVVSLAVSNSGRICVTGNSSEDVDFTILADITTIMYDEQGDPIWIANYNPAASHDRAVDLALGSLGRVAVAGDSNSDIIALLYDPEGHLLWSRGYGGPEGGYDRAAAVAVDSSNNVYVTGTTRSVATNDDIVTIKFDSAGNQQWVSTYNGPADGKDVATAMAVDSSGNAYVSGYSDGGATDTDFITIKYDAYGQPLWSDRYDAATNKRDGALALSLDAVGNVVVAGYSGDLPVKRSWFAPHVIVLKYNPNGELIWATEPTATRYGKEYPVALEVDSAGQPSVLAECSRIYPHESRLATIQYDADGNLKWIDIYDGDKDDGAIPADIALDGAGNIYVAGNTKGGDADMFLLRYDSHGNRNFIAWYDGPYRRPDHANALALNPAGGIFLAGSSEGMGTGSDYVLISYGAKIVQSPAGSAHKSGSDGGGCFVMSINR